MSERDWPFGPSIVFDDEPDSDAASAPVPSARDRWRHWLAPLALLVAALGAAATIAVYLVSVAVIATIIAWAAVVLTTLAALLGMVAVVLGPHRGVAGLAVAVGLLSNPVVLWSVIAAARELTPYAG